MSTLGGMIRYSNRRSILGIKPRRNSKSGWLPREKWEQKLKKEGKWIDYGKGKRT